MLPGAGLLFAKLYGDPYLSTRPRGCSGLAGRPTGLGRQPMTTTAYRERAHAATERLAGWRNRPSGSGAIALTVLAGSASPLPAVLG